MSILIVFAVFAAVQVSSLPTQRQECPMPYLPVGGRCLYFDPFVSGTWSEGRNLCQSLQGDLIQLDSADLMADVVAYIYEHGITGHDYWIGGSDAADEGHWVWPDGSKVRMGTPFWGYVSNGYPIHQEPQGGTKENYICLLERTAYFFHDCSHTTVSPICEYRANLI